MKVSFKGRKTEQLGTIGQTFALDYLIQHDKQRYEKKYLW